MTEKPSEQCEKCTIKPQRCCSCVKKNYLCKYLTMYGECNGCKNYERRITLEDFLKEFEGIEKT